MAQINDNSDLLILSEDDTNMDTLVLDDTLATTNEPEAELITFDDMSLDFSADEKKETVKQDNSDNLDLSSFGTESTSTNTTEVKTEAANDFNFDLTDSTPVTTEATSVSTTPIVDLNTTVISNTPVISENVGTMVSILDKAIHELETRSEVIVSEISTEENNISDLKSKIAKLESEVLVSETKVTELTDEKTMIAKNIKSLDKMKQIEHAALKKAA